MSNPSIKSTQPIEPKYDKASAASIANGLPIAVVIPMYRVAPYIQRVISEIPEWITWIIAVDDASPDDSANIVRKLTDPRIVLVQHAVNQGVGGATISGFLKAIDVGAKIAVKLDGDGQMNISFLQKMVEPLLAGQADYTKGNRFFHVVDIGKNGSRNDAKSSRWFHQRSRRNQYFIWVESCQ